MEKHQIAAAAIRGDDAALVRRIEMDKRQMYGIAFAYMRNEADALDAVQETVYRVWLKRRTLRDERLFTTWMIRILINVCMDERRKKKREHERLAADEQLRSGSLMPSEGLEERLDMAELVAQLPAKYRMIIILKYYRDLTITEIAELLEKPDGTIKTWLNQALKQLRGKKIESKEDTANEARGRQGI